MRNLSKRSYADWGESFFSAEIRTQTEKENLKSSLAPEVQRYIGSIRTDLDTFSKAEIAALYQHGTNVAKTVVAEMADDIGAELNDSGFQNNFVDTSIDKLTMPPLLWKLKRILDFFKTWWSGFTLFPILLVALGSYLFSNYLEAMQKEDEINQRVAQVEQQAAEEVEAKIRDYDRRHGPLKTIVPGCSIGLIEDGGQLTSFSLGCIVRDESGKVFGLTAGHVASNQQAWRDSAVVVQPGPTSLDDIKNRICLLYTSPSPRD